MRTGRTATPIGRMAWDDPVRKHIDFFRLSDPRADANVTVRDLHRNGISRHDRPCVGSPWGRGRPNAPGPGRARLTRLKARVSSRTPPGPRRTTLAPHAGDAACDRE